MKIRKFTATSLKEGKQLIIKELGDEAVILSSRSVKSADDENEMIEIVAAIDDSPMRSNRSKLKLPERTYSQESNPITEAGISETDFYNALSRIYIEMSDIKSMITDVSESVKFKYTGVLGNTLGNLYKALRKAEVKESWALNIAGRLSAEGHIKDSKNIIKRASELLLSGIEIYNHSKKANKHSVSVFVGPTGSGKTLSLIKLAVVTKLVNNAQLIIISTDTQKIGAAEQLQTFASIAAIPFKSVYSTDELSEFLAKESEFEYVFIDTVGKSQFDIEHLSELKEYINTSKAEDIFLTLSAATSDRNIAAVIDSYHELKPTGLIITKLDEIDVIGNVLGGLSNKGIPVAYLCAGQKIPEDIEPASKEWFAKMILPDDLILDN